MKTIKKLELGNIYLEYRNDNRVLGRNNAEDCNFKCITVFKVIRQEEDSYIISVLDCCRSGTLEFGVESFNRELVYKRMDITRLLAINEMFELNNDESNKMAIAFL